MLRGGSAELLPGGQEPTQQVVHAEYGAPPRQVGGVECVPVERHETLYVAPLPRSVVTTDPITWCNSEGSLTFAGHREP